MTISIIILCLFFGYAAFDYFSKREKNGCWLFSALGVLVVIGYFLMNDDIIGTFLGIIVALGIIGIVGFLMYVFGK